MTTESPKKFHLKILELHQTPSGGFIASLDYVPYHKVWIRDHCFVSLVLFELQEISMFKKACDFLCQWLDKIEPDLSELLKLPRNEFLAAEGLHPKARYFPDLSNVPGPWLERQYDGTALALATLSKCYQMFNKPSFEGMKLLADYLLKAFRTSCADLWEMHENWIHSETLGAIYYGLENFAKIAPEYHEKAQGVFEFLSNLHIKNGTVRKMVDPENGHMPVGIDTSVLLLWTWFGVPLGFDILERTLSEVLDRLSPDGLMLKRFEIQELGEIDTYFGGNPWVITTLWGGEAYLLLKKYSKAREILRIFENMHFLPEQILTHTSDTSYFEDWRERVMGETRQQVGQPARILAWSHAEFLRFSRMIGQIHSNL